MSYCGFDLSFYLCSLKQTTEVTHIIAKEIGFVIVSMSLIFIIVTARELADPNNFESLVNNDRYFRSGAICFENPITLSLSRPSTL